MRICFLLQELGRSGGAATVLGHAERLRSRHGFDVDVVVTDPRAEPADRPSGEYDVAIATWWQTAAALYRVNARRRALFVQSFEERFYRPTEPFARLGAGLVLALPVDYLVVAEWMRDALAELRPDANVRVVPNGVDKQVFEPRARHAGDGPLRVLVEGQPTLWFKGTRDAFEAVRGMAEPVHATLIAHDPSEADGLDADEVVGGLDAAGMAERYARSDVVLKLSRLEGLPLPPLEAMHVGVPCVATPHTGHDEYLTHGENGLVVGFDDLAGTSATLDLLARDRGVLARLSEGALARAARWPSSDDSTAALAEALGSLQDAPPPDQHRAAEQMLLRSRAAGELGGHYVGRLRWAESGLAHAQAENRELSESRDECAEMLEQARRERDEAVERLARLRATLPWRIASRARRVVRGRGG